MTSCLPHLIAAPILLPLHAALLLFLWPQPWRLISLLVAGLTLVATALLLDCTLTQGGIDYALGAWQRPLGVHWRLDAIGALLLLTTSVLMLAVLVAMMRAPASVPGVSTQDQSYLMPLCLFLWTGLSVLFTAADLFQLYVALELVTLSAVALVALGRDSRALDAATRYLFAAVFGSLLYLLGLALLYGQYAVLDVGLLGERMQAEALLTDALAITAITLGLLLKAALVPLHFWLPAAHSRAKPGVSALLSGLVVASGSYLLLRLWLGPFQPWLQPPVSTLLGAIGAATMLWGALQALQQRRLKRVIAYSTVSQSGLILLALPLALGEGSAFVGAILLMVNHALAKAALFLSAGLLVRQAGHDHLSRLGQACGPLAPVWLAFALAALALIGAPPSLGFAGKWALLQAAVAQHAWGWLGLIVLSSLLTLAYLYRVAAPALGPSSSQTCPITDGPTAIAWSEYAIVLLLAGLAFTLGLLILPLVPALEAVGAGLPT